VRNLTSQASVCAMWVKRLNDIVNLPESDKSHILYTIDNLLASVKTRLAYRS